jgi:hypothetical protein
MSDQCQLPREIAEKPKAYAFERSLGMPPAEACRRAGGKVENGQATKWERNRRVQAWIAYYRSLGNDEEMLAAKRARIEERLELAAYGNIFDFSTMVDRVVIVQVDKETTEERTVKTPVIDWDKVAKSPYGAIVSGFKFDKDTGVLVDFERDSALQAAAQLRDMHGFKAPARTELTGKNGAALFDLSKLNDEQLATLERIASAASVPTAA